MTTIDEISKITNKGKDNPFKVPEDYFTHLQKDIMSAIADNPTKIVEMKQHRSFFRPAVTVAASLLFAVCGMAIWFNNSSNGNESSLANSTEFNDMLSDTDGASAYLMLNSEDYYSYLVQQ